MRKLAVLTFTSLDGVMQAPSLEDEDPSGGFNRGGWARPHWEDVMTQVRLHAMDKPYDMLFGRKTYDLFARHWTGDGQDSDEGRFMTAARKYVASRNLGELTWSNSEYLSGEIPQAITKLKEEDGPLIQVHGSSNLIQTLIKHRLVDEFRVWTFPVIVGSGKRLFENDDDYPDLYLTKAALTERGVTMGFYACA